MTTAIDSSSIENAARESAGHTHTPVGDLGYCAGCDNLAQDLWEKHYTRLLHILHRGGPSTDFEATFVATFRDSERNPEPSDLWEFPQIEMHHCAMRSVEYRDPWE